MSSHHKMTPCRIALARKRRKNLTFTSSHQETLPSRQLTSHLDTLIDTNLATKSWLKTRLTHLQTQHRWGRHPSYTQVSTNCQCQKILQPLLHKLVSRQYIQRCTSIVTAKCRLPSSLPRVGSNRQRGLQESGPRCQEHAMNVVAKRYVDAEVVFEHPCSCVLTQSDTL